MPCLVRTNGGRRWCYSGSSNLSPRRVLQTRGVRVRKFECSSSNILVIFESGRGAEQRRRMPPRFNSLRRRDRLMSFMSTTKPNTSPDSLVPGMKLPHRIVGTR